VLEGCATLQELECHWSMEDVLDCNDLLDMRGDIKAEACKPKRDKS